MNDQKPISHLIAKCQDRAREHKRSFEEIAMYRELTEALLELSRLRSSDAVQVLAMIDQLRAEECSFVSIFHDNPDFIGPNCIVQHTSFASEHVVERTYRGETVKACLEEAVLAMNSERGES